MEQLPQNKQSGCLRTGLILVILLVSISGAAWVLGLRSGMYSGVDLPEKPLVIRGGTLFDGTGDSLIHDAVIVIAGEEIQCIGCTPPADAIVIDATGKSILPGLIDMHVHYYAPSRENAGASKITLLLSYLRYRPEIRQHMHRAGITSFRSVGDVPANILRIKSLIESGEGEGPDVFCAGPVFTVDGGHPAATTFLGDEGLIREATRRVTGPVAGQEEVAALVREGVEGIRIAYEARGTLPRMSKEILSAIIEQARAEGVWTAVSTSSPEEMRDAIHAGATTIERGSLLPTDSALWQEVAAAGGMLVPAMSPYRDSACFQVLRENVALAAALGVPIGSGSDIQTDTRGYAAGLHEEMELLVAAGLTPVQVLLGATGQAARFLKADHLLGTVAAGKRANLIIVNGRPWEDMGDIRKVETVIQRGRWVLKNGKFSD